MKIDIGMIGATSRACGPLARQAESCGFDGVWASESVCDPFLQAQAALLETSGVAVGTAIAVAFARNPMTTAYAAWDLAGSSEGRFKLGLGSQVKSHIENRFSMPWDAPVARIREFLDALEAIFGTWRTGAPLDYRGRFYRHVLMSPVFTPSRHEYPIPLLLAAVGEQMVTLGAERGDGLILHAMTTQAYLDTVTLPAVERGLEISARSRDALEIYAVIFMIIGDSEQEIAEQTQRTREQLAFYASTPAYVEVLASIGAEALQGELHQLARQGRWEEMGRLVDDRVLGEFTLIGAPEEMPGLARQRFGERLDRVSSLHNGWPLADLDRMRSIVDAFHADGRASGPDERAPAQ